MENVKEEVIFLSGQGNHQLGADILCELSELFGQRCVFSHININSYPEKELDNRIVDYQKIKDKIVVVYQSMFTPEFVDEAMDLIWACKHQYGARHIIAVLPFLWNRRQDPIMTEDDKEKWSRKIAKPDEIQRLRKIIHLLSVCGVNELLVATPHSNKMAKYCEDYDIKFHEIDPSMQFANTIQTYIPSENMSIARIYAPDAGSIPRAVNIARILRCPVIFNLKNREYNRETSIVKDKEEILENLSKEFREYYHFEELYHITPELVTDKIMIMIEDEVASGGTANETARMLQKCEVKSIFLLATHAVLTLGWRNKLFYLNPFKKIIMTNTITRGYDKRTGGSIFDITLAPQFASYLFKILKRL